MSIERPKFKSPGPTSATTRENISRKTEKQAKRKHEFLENLNSKAKKRFAKNLPTLAKHNVEDLRTVIHQSYVKRFKRSRTPKYGNLNKGFTEYELQRFFKAIDSDKFRILFSYQAQLGLRIGEAVKLNVKNINFQTRELTLKTEKARIIDTLLFPFNYSNRPWISSKMKPIKASNGYVFFKDCRSASKLPYLKNDYVRNRFRFYVELADIDQVYDISDESYQSHVPRRLQVWRLCGKPMQPSRSVGFYRDHCLCHRLDLCQLAQLVPEPVAYVVHFQVG